MNFKIFDRLVGDGAPCFIIGELSANHLKNFDLAVETIEAIKVSGADAVKFQTYTPETITLDCPNKYFRIDQDNPWKGKFLYQLYEEAYMPWDWQPELKKLAEKLGLVVLSSPFDVTAVDFLEDIGIHAYKIASFEITDLTLIEYVASKGKPVIISTGIAEISDIELAIEACRKADNEQIALLKCSSAYPTPLESLNLKTIPDMAQRFNTVVGLSDHTLELAVPLGSVALGAKIIEKHFILNRELGGPDASFSLIPEEFTLMVKHTRALEKALGEVKYDLSDKQKESRDFSRSLFVVKDIKEGEVFTNENLKSIRPGFGLHPKHISQVLGKNASQNIPRGTPLKWEFVK
jgi:pseudaminic acid synthase